jgi:acetyltransferase
MLARLTQIDYDREMAFVAAIERDGAERLIGVSRYIADPDGEGCEFALAVADEWQKKGIGTALMRALLDRARSKGLRRMHGEVLAENYNMLALCHELGLTERGSREDPMLRTVTLDLAPPALLATAVSVSTSASTACCRVHVSASD